MQTYSQFGSPTTPAPVPNRLRLNEGKAIAVLRYQGNLSALVVNIAEPKVRWVSDPFRL